MTRQRPSLLLLTTTFVSLVVLRQSHAAGLRAAASARHHNDNEEGEKARTGRRKLFDDLDIVFCPADLCQCSDGTFKSRGPDCGCDACDDAAGPQKSVEDVLAEAQSLIEQINGGADAQYLGMGSSSEGSDPTVYFGTVEARDYRTDTPTASPVSDSAEDEDGDGDGDGAEEIIDEAKDLINKIKAYEEKDQEKAEDVDIVLGGQSEEVVETPAKLRPNREEPGYPEQKQPIDQKEGSRHVNPSKAAEAEAQQRRHDSSHQEVGKHGHTAGHLNGHLGHQHAAEEQQRGPQGPEQAQGKDEDEQDDPVGGVGVTTVEVPDVKSMFEQLTQGLTDQGHDVHGEEYTIVKTKGEESQPEVKKPEVAVIQTKASVQAEVEEVGEQVKKTITQIKKNEEEMSELEAKIEALKDKKLKKAQKKAAKLNKKPLTPEQIAAKKAKKAAKKKKKKAGIRKTRQDDGSI